MYVEHNTPRPFDVDNVHHPLAECDHIPVVHVTDFNRMMWDNGAATTHVVNHGIRIPVRTTATTPPRRRVYLHTGRWTSPGLSLVGAMLLGMPLAAAASTVSSLVVPPEAGGRRDPIVVELHRRVDFAAPVNIGGPVELTVLQLAELICDLGRQCVGDRAAPPLENGPQRDSGLTYLGNGAPTGY